ncbi:uncharacterized protein LOC108712235 [Xenopus laevis]|uniref:Uncharacterized protein LOC108712235 n=1 Tax=Xenopus laevis TaxID=8355 RepID=A0A8J1KM67_XENLA|nr:uncharacterized protein LOC108712235 [Xenopus laevis]XP_041417326.1 uncharacterized protein LOC108712235 [Xenopus laevis]
MPPAQETTFFTKMQSLQRKTLEDRKQFLKDNNICFRCCTTTSHFARNCEVSVSCSECGSTEHNMALHPGPPSQAVHQTEDHEKKQIDTDKTNTVVTSQCTEICKGVVGGKSCSKICLVRVYPASHRDKAIKAYAILDDQSNRSLAKSTFFDTFNITGPGSPYSLRTCAGTVETAGRKATGYKVESIDGQTCLSLPTILECNQIPDNRSEIPTPEVAAYHPHLKRIAHQIPELDPEAPIALLLGRDILRVHKARGQINGSQNAPYAQRLDLGWVIIGDVCLGGAHKPISVNSMLTNTLESRRPSLFQPCQNSFLIKEMPHRDPVPCPFMDPSSEDHACDGERDHLGCTVFHRSREDNKVAMSIEDRLFLEIMDQGMTKDNSKSWVAPLPFRPQRQRLPDNKELVYNRFISLKHKLQKTPEMKENFRTFYVYVSNRVLRIRRSTSPQQWHYVPTQHNPTDYATRSVAACHLKATTWFTGPAFLYRSTACNIGCDTFELIDPDADEEIRPEVSVLNTVTSDRQLESHRFSRFSTWMSLVRAIAILIHIAFKSYTSTLPVSQKPCKGWHHCKSAFTASNLERSKDIIIHTIQHECYTKEIEYLRKGQTVSKDSALRRLDPVIDQGGLMRIGGRLQEAKVDFREKHPIVIPGHHHVATLLIRHHHLQTKHQGRMFTEGNLRAAGLWIVGAKRRVSQVIFNCITCRKLRGVSQNPKMASLPAERLSTDPPFTNVGLDVFGPWSVATRHTRGVHTGAKRWAVMFTCMSSRAVHIEVIESMDASSFINAFRRFIAIRGPVKCIRSDRGTNFVGAVKELQIPSNLDTAKVDRYLNEQGCTWTFNPPHSSHMGGVWERMIGIARKILDSIFSQVGSTRLTHESLVTFLAEVSAIMNARPLTTLSSDPEDLMILTPAMLLTQKTSTLSAPSGEFTEKDLYRRQWRQVQSLSNVFWDKWRKEYVSTLQSRRKWQTNKPNIRPGDVVLMKDHQSHRNEWPLGLITNTFPSKDGNVRKAEVKICKLGECKLFLRPTTELVLLFSPEKTSSDIC